MGSHRTAVVLSLTGATLALLAVWALLPVLDAVPGATPSPAATHTAPAAPRNAPAAARPSLVAAKRSPVAASRLPKGKGRPKGRAAAPSPKALPPSPLPPAFTAYHVPASGVQAGQKVIALTFDDGPDPTWTPQILSVLAQAGVTATFFMIGWEAAADPALVEQVVAAGNGVGNHTWNHLDLTQLSPAAFSAQVDRTTQLLDSLTGRPVTCLRPPQGDINATVEAELASRGLTAVLWNDDTRDWTRPGTAAIIHAALSEAKPGGIIEMHDGGGDRSETVQALPAIIAGLRAQGYQFVPLCR
ncbi:MAG: polysaccharide deacetylase family protein [Actinomycetota bacterium]